MNRLFLQVAMSVITLLAGAGFHQLVVALAEAALPYDTISIDEPSSTNNSCDVEDAFFATLVISLGDRRDVYLGKQLVGNPDDTSGLEAKLQSKFQEYEQARMELQSSDYKWVYIKASTRSSCGDIIRLIEASRRAGVQRLSLVADKRKKGGS